MEQIVLGLSKSVVEGTLSKVRSAIEEEAKLKLTVQSDLVFITGEFEMMQSFLNVADATELMRNHAFKTWVRQLRDLSYDTEDCIELVIHLDPKPAWWRRLLPGASLPIDDAAAEVKQLKERVEHVSQRNMRYNHITGGVSTVSVVQQQQLDRIRALDITFEATKKKKSGNLDLVELIMATKDKTEEDRGGELRVISVWGTGGDLGMTSIIRKAYDDPEICKNFKYRGWAKLTLPLNPREILRSLLTQFCRNTLQKRGATTLDVDSLLKMEAMVGATQGDELIKEFVQHVNNHRYLVVLEDVSTMVEWDTIRMYLPDTGNGSQIIVSTQHFDIASLCTSQPYKVSEFRKFTNDHSVCVFSKEDSQCDRGGKTFGDIKSGSVDKPRLIGRKTEKKQLALQLQIQSGECCRVISVWGIAGVGKSTLVRTVCDEHVGKLQHISRWVGIVADTPSTSSIYMHGWVNVSHPFNLRQFCRSLLLDLSTQSPQVKKKAESDLARISDPVEVCRELLSVDCKCLIVINNLQSAEEWDSIRQALLFGQGCLIIVVTTEASVAKHCSGEDKFVFNIKGLNNEFALELFNEVYDKQPGAHQRDEGKNKQAELILRKCGGLPKVIVSVGGFLARKLKWEEMDKRFMQQLETNPELESVQSLFGWLDSYFHTCPDFLKPCIFYLSIFPRGVGIRRKRLVRRWIAEGYSRDTDDGNLAHVNAESYFSRLVDLSMVQQPEQHDAVAGTGRRMPMCHINDFFREYIISRRMEENHVFSLEGSCSQTTQRTGRHLVIDQTWNRDKNVFDRIDFSRLRSLTAFGSWKPFFTSDKMRVLRVLDLEGTKDGLVDDDVKLMVKRLPRLKFLSLRGCKEISHLPDYLGRLRQLETLDVRHTGVASLPGTVTKLQKLQYVRAGTSPSQHVTTPASRTSWLPGCLSFAAAGYHVGVDVPGGFGDLTNLHTLGVMNATVAGFKELKKLTLLRKLGVSGINRKNHKGLCSVISGHAHMESLSVWFDKDMLQGTGSHLEDDDLESPKKLQNLKLHGHLHRLPLWIKKLQSLAMLDLEVSVFDMQNLEDRLFLQGLPHLVLLRLRILEQLQDGELRVAFDVDSLKVLEISYGSGRLHVTFQEEALKNLVALKLRCDGLMSSLELLGLENLNCIKEVMLEGSYDDRLKKDLQVKLKGHPKKPALKEVQA